MKLNQALLIFLILTAPTMFAFAADVTGQARLFLGSTKINPSDVNSDLTTQSLQTMDSLNQYGVEITFPVIKYLNLGLRYTRHDISKDPVNSGSANYKAEISQDSMLAVARVPFFKTDIVHIDGFAGLGGSNTTYKITSAAEDGELDKKNSFFASPDFSFGGSIAFGYKKYFFVIEGGYEINKITGLQSSGTVNNISTIDLSGTYVAVGIMFDEIPIHK